MATHSVFNVPPPLVEYNTYRTDAALIDGVHREGAGWAEASIDEVGARTGQADYIKLGFLANENKPVLSTHDRFGFRVDLVEFHPAYHQLMAQSIEWGLHASPWTEPGAGSNVARAAKYYLQAQVEAAHGCPITMTFAATPSLRHDHGLAEFWLPRIHSSTYDPSNRPVDEKLGATLGMAMTEKQGGSDVRANTTRAVPAGSATGSGELYALTGHKFFVSAPMCDAFLVLAQTEGGLSCFVVPRWLPDGEKNPFEIQQLKVKMGNVANASCETELRGALGRMIGDEGRGVATIIEMVAMTRFDCMIGSSAGMRQGVAQAAHHTRFREAFGKPLNEQPLMDNVLADLAIEAEGSLAMTLRVARALDESAGDAQSEALARIATAVGKYWICKRTPGHAYETMEVIGGSGVMETSIMPRLFRESPINAIWEGSGNVQCLDILRALQRSPETAEAFVAEIRVAAGADARLDRATAGLETMLVELSTATGPDQQFQARTLADRLATVFIGSLLVRHAPTAVADGFCASRLTEHPTHNYGCLPTGVDTASIVARATPRL
ncbi:MAG: acyl-CoA dehydrogenase family protein [Acidimicrobiia bacterium]|nr:acyl-CoA dehydrogenase family protein [Acidimicrobiia bacterium]MBP8180512.1 acyl-CoA dehydrogenase family protein [Acidimicrobiia bacterium]